MADSCYFPLPTQVAQIDARWLTAALRQRTPDVTVIGFEIIEVIDTTTTKLRIRLQLNDAGKRAGIPDQVILKGGFKPHSREPAMAHMHEREVRGYRDVFPVVPLPHPACYFADYDPTGPQGIIIMEDLTTRGVTICHATRPQSFEQVALRLTYLARFHAATWDSEEIAPGRKWEELPDFFDVMRGFFARCSSRENWDRFMTMPRGVATTFRLRDRDWMRDSWDKVCRYSKTLPRCVLHGDVHLGNLYIEPDGTPGFFDTLASTGPGMLEVSYHISASVDIADRADWEGALVQHYLAELERNGVTPIGFDEAMHQYGVFLLYGLFIWQTTESHFQTEAVNTANCARMSAACLDHDLIGLMVALK
jgi:hypothetical protein